MALVNIKAKSSSGGIYDVTFSISKSLLTVKCNCKAGIFGQLCKHKLRLLRGDHTMLADPGQIDLLKEVLSFVSQSERDILKKLADLRDEIEEAKRKEKHLKKAIERSMKQGFKITTR